MARRHADSRMNFQVVVWLVVAVVIALPLWALVASYVAKNQAEAAEQRVRQAFEWIDALKGELAALRKELQRRDDVVEERKSVASSAVAEVAATPTADTAAILPVAPAFPPPVPAESPPAIELLGAELTLKASEVPAIPDAPPVSPPRALPPPLPEARVARETLPPVPPSGPAAKLDLERFLGVKLFAWLGGLALFFAILFFVKYSFDRNLIPPAGRVAIGFVFGVGLLVAGLLTQRKPAYAVLAQTFLASGVLILYGVSYAGHVHYRIFGPAEQSALVAFGLMAATTVVAFLLAVRLRAQVVAVLGMVGGFLTPVLCSTGRDAPVALFGYIAILDVGLLLVAARRKWTHLVPLAALGTIVLGLGWFGTFFRSGGYAEGSATLLPMGIVLFFVALFGVAAWRIRTETVDRFVFGSSVALVLAAVTAGYYFLSFPAIAQRPGLLHGFMLAVGAAGVIVSFAKPTLSRTMLIVAVLGFIHAGQWCQMALTRENLPVLLIVALAFAGVHVGLPIVLQRWLKRGVSTPTLPGEVAWMGPLTLGLLVMPAAQLPGASASFWAALMVANLAQVAFALALRRVAPLAAGYVLTLVIGLVWLDRLPRDWDMPFVFYPMLVGFGAVLAGASVWLGKKRISGNADAGPPISGPFPPEPFVPALPALLPFGMLMALIDRLDPLPEAPVFGAAMGLGLLLLALARWGGLPVLSLVALIGVATVEALWHRSHFDSAHPGGPLLWYVGIHAAFTVYPFVFSRAFREKLTPWVAAAASGVCHFLLVHATVKAGYPSFAGRLGWIPVYFAVPAGLCLTALVKVIRSSESIRPGQLAWFGSVFLLFVTLIFPIQLERHWLTVAWAMEGAALLWLSRRIPHRGLVWTGLALLGTSFVRLIFNPAIILAYPRSEMPIWNWHLYTYGIASAALMAGAWWLRRPDPSVLERMWPRLLWAGGGILLFALVNIEIADFFTERGEPVIVLFSHRSNLARDMTTTMAWGVFALGLLVIGFAVRSRGARRAGVGLLAVTLLKLFLHDLAELQTFYRIAALAVIAIIALAASFLYQRHFDRSADE